jgi:hypothetical protein
MAEDPTAITADEFTTWMLPSAALQLLYTSGSIDYRTGKLAILKRLQHGLIQAVAETGKLQNSSGTLVPITQKEWGYAEDGIVPSPLWVTGDITIAVPMHTYEGYTRVPVYFFNVRFNPTGVRALLPPEHVEPVSAQQSKPEPSETADPPEQEKGPSVSPEHLREWFELYKKVYQGPQDTEANALASAAGMFPGKSVSRDRVRALRGAQKRGRKARGEP